MPNAPDGRRVTTHVPASDPPHRDVGRAWLFLVASLLIVALASVTLLRPACRIDVAGTAESGFGIRHEKRGTQWYHCEPWIARRLTKRVDR